MRKHYLVLALFVVLLAGCSDKEEPVVEEPTVHIPALRASLEDATFNWDVLTTDPHTESLHEMRDITEETVGDEIFFNTNVGENLALSLKGNTIREKLFEATLSIPKDNATTNYNEFYTAATLILRSTQPILNEEGRILILQELGLDPNATYDNVNSTYETRSTYYSLQEIDGQITFMITAK